MKKYIALVTVCLFGCTGLQKDPSRSIATSGRLLVDGSGYAFDPNDTSCDGYPRVQVETMAGTCLGMVISQQKKSGGKPILSMPRTILQVPGTSDFLVADMGSWNANSGFLFLLKKKGDDYDIVTLKSKLNTPHGLELSNDGFIYLGENQRITRFHYSNGKIFDEELVTGNLPANKGDMHPLTQFVFNPINNDLYINSGAPTDHCAKSAGQPCAEDNTQDNGAAIVRIPGSKLVKIPKGGVPFREISARGLRNSMAMAISPAGTFLVEGENGRDFPEVEEPYEEMNILNLADDSRGTHHGWPYCYDFHATSPEWLFDQNKTSTIRREHGEMPFPCGQGAKSDMYIYQPPHSLMPPHAAPLHALHYEGDMFKNILDGKLMMTWHGYRPGGHRLVAYDVDKNGVPLAHAPQANDKFNIDPPSGCPKATPYNPRQGSDQHASYTEVISGWYPIKNVRPRGAPTGFTVADDGSIWVVEDKNKTILRLAKSNNTYSDKCGNKPTNTMDPNIIFLAWRNALEKDPGLKNQYKYLREQLYPAASGATSQGKGYCLGCHENFRNKELSGNEDIYTFMDFLVRSEWLKPKSPETSPIYSAIRHTGTYPPMPPQGMPELIGNKEGETIIQAMYNWIKVLPTDVEQSIAQVTVPTNLNIREAPTKGAKVCGQYRAQDIAYIDPRPTSKVVADGITWRKTYLVPGHTRLFLHECLYPIDGVYYSSFK
jgi:glucose/arabinose dehydrogenase